MAPHRTSGRNRRTKAPDTRETTALRGAFLANQLFARLDDAIRSRLTPHLQIVQLEQLEVLFRAHDPLRVVYFPSTAVVSLVSQLESGQTLEVGMVGRDGIVGTALFPGIVAMSCDAIVQVPGSALRLSADVLRREMRADEALHSAVGRYAQVLLTKCMQMSLCNMFHTVEQRCVRWLLTANDLNANDHIAVTQEMLAVLLGVHRPTVTTVLGSLKRAGLLNEERGCITIRNRRGLEAACCECYGLMRDEQRRLLGY